MASKLPSGEDFQSKSTQCREMTWSCTEHGETISFYCKQHNTSICDQCAVKDHDKTQCELQDIEEVILENRKKLEDSQTRIAEAKECWKTLDSEIESSVTSLTNHLQSVNDEISTRYDKKLKSVKDTEKEKIRLTNEETDEERDERRERRIKACKEEAEKQRLLIKESEEKLISDIKTITEIVTKTIDDLRSRNQRSIDTVDNISSKIERIIQNEETLVNEAPQVIASLDESLCSNVHQEVADYLDEIECEVQRVKFIEGEVGGEHYERIDGYIGKWELVKSIDIPSIVKDPFLAGVVSEDEIMLCKINGTTDICASYVTNISTEQTKKVTEEYNRFVTSCPPIDSNVIAYGKGAMERHASVTGDSLDRYITLYDRQWNVIREITIPRNTSYTYIGRYVDIDVDRDGMIIAAESDQSNIYVINPADGKIVKTITMQNKKAQFEIHALPSGDFLVQTVEAEEYTVFSRSGEKKDTIYCHDCAGCYVDKLTDTLYFTYSDNKSNNLVDQLSCDGDIQARRIVKFKPTLRFCSSSACLLTPSGNVVGSDGDQLFVYKKSFILQGPVTQHVPIIQPYKDFHSEE